MTLKPNYLRGFVKTVAWFSALIFLFEGAIPLLRGRSVVWSEIAGFAVIGSVFMGVGVCVMFTPREISWSEYTIALRVNFPRSGHFDWQQLQGYSAWSGRFSTFLLKLKGEQAYQIVPACFDRDEWREFQQFLRTRFPEKKTWIWLGPLPLRFGRR